VPFDARTFHVTVFVLDVTHVADDWPERNLRQRLWLNSAQALVRLEEDGLRDILRGVVARQAG